MHSMNRWVIAVAGIVMQIALGAVYAWSVFRIPLTQAYGVEHLAGYSYFRIGDPRAWSRLLSPAGLWMNGQVRAEWR